jgi:selenocysteine lyase/cysteine desulfurase
MPIDVQKVGCHMLAATSRKYLRGPRGMGFLYVERSLCQNLEPVFLDLHAASLQTADTFKIRADARRFENWECNVAAKLGLGAAVEYALAQGLEPMWLRIQQLAGYLRQRLTDIPGFTLRDPGIQKSGIVTFTHRDSSAAQLQQWLAGQEKRINVTTSTFRSTLLDMQHRDLLEVSRASLHAYNTEAEIDTMIAALSRLPRV